VNCGHCGEPIFLQIKHFPVVCTNCSHITGVDDRIDAWHDGDSKLPLHEFLGMSREEFNYWVRYGTREQNSLGTE
jgi:hypothetical protein